LLLVCTLCPGGDAPETVKLLTDAPPGTKTLRDTADHQIAHSHRAAPMAGLRIVLVGRQGLEP
jgi:hypothetical protein